MKTTNTIILITGGGSGIGLETARLLAQKGNTVIITGRQLSKLESAAKGHANIHPIACDITDGKQVTQLVERIKKEFGGLHILINNAGVANLHTLHTGELNVYETAQSEMDINYFSVVRLVDQFLPLLKQQAEAAIVNVSSIVAFSPSITLPTYSATKAALHSYTQILRLTLSDTSVKVFEVMPPLVDTDMAKDIQRDKIPASDVAQALYNGLEKEIYEIRVGFTETFYGLYLQSPVKALDAMNGRG